MQGMWQLLQFVKRNYPQNIDMDEECKIKRKYEVFILLLKMKQSSEDSKGARSILSRIGLDLGESEVLALSRSHWGFLVHPLSAALP